MRSTVVYNDELRAIKPQTGPAFKRMPVNNNRRSGFSTPGLLATPANRE
ncbi:MAG: hypothetical protein ACXWV2_06205 [Chitinophagaceae bacterium]